MNHLLLRVLIFFSCFSAFSSWSQQAQFQFINFSETDGLLDHFIYSCTKDSKGNLWLGTGTGLYKYNGNTFTPVKSSEDNASGQIGNILERVFATKKNQLLLSSLNAFQVYDLNTKHFKSVEKQAGFDPSKMGITGFFEANNGTIWVLLKEYLIAEFNPITRKLTLLPTSVRQKLPDAIHPYKLVETQGGKLVVLTSNGIYSYDPRAQKLLRVEHSEQIDGHFTDGLLAQGNNAIWLVSPKTGLVKWNLKTNNFETVFSANDSKDWKVLYPTRLAWKSKDEIWLGGSELGFFGLKKTNITRVLSQYEDENSFRTIKIQQLFNDNGNLWICSHFGISLLPSSNQNIERIDLRNPHTQTFIEPYETIRLGNGDLMTAGALSNGASIYDQRLKTLRIVPCEGRGINDLSGTFCVVKTTSNKVFVGAHDGLYELNASQTSLKRIPLFEKNGTPISGIQKILASKNVLVMASRKGGFYVYNTRSKLLKHLYLNGTRLTTSKNNVKLVPQYIDRTGKVWFSIEKGLAQFDIQTEKMTVITRFLDQKKRSCSLDKISGITSDVHGNLWLSTFDNGIYSLNLSSKTLRNYNKTNTFLLSSDYCFSINKDKNGTFWIGTLNGLIQFDPKEKRIMRVLQKQHGLVKSNIDVGLSLIDGNEIMINHYGALSVFEIARLKSVALQPRFEWIEIMGKSRTVQTHYDLSHNANFLALHWSSGIYGNRNNSLFAYRLSPARDGWTYTNKTEMSFVGLPPGEYHFDLKVYRSDGSWSATKTMVFVIHPPFYQTWWFRSVLVLVILGAIYAVYVLNIRRIKRREIQKSAFVKRVSELELKALRAQMNPHFIFNSLNSIQKYILKNDTFNTSQYLTKFSRLIRLILENSSETHLSLADEIEQIKLYVEIEQLRFENRFEFELQVDGSLQPDFIKIPTMVIQPYVENAIWHGLLHKEEKGTLEIHISKRTAKQLEIVIHDNGVGRDVASKMKTQHVFKKKSLGMKITEDRIELLNRTSGNRIQVDIIDLKDASQGAAGTQVVLTIDIP